MKRFIIEQSGEEFYTSRSGLALVGLSLNRFTSLSTAVVVIDALGDLIAGGINIIRSYCALLAQGMRESVLVTARHRFIYGGQWHLPKRDEPMEGRPDTATTPKCAHFLL